MWRVRARRGSQGGVHDHVGGGGCGVYDSWTVGLIYLAALILGLGTLALQFILSHGGGDAGDHAFEADGGAEADHDLGHGEAQGAGIGGAAALFLSMRFWTFGLMSFGMVGAAIHYLNLCNAIACALVSGVFGVGSGLLASFVFKNLTRGVSSSESATDAIGQLGRVLVPASKEHAGKVRIQIKGKVVDLLATSDSDVAEGEEVLVVEVRGTNAHVERAPTASDKS